MSDRNRFERLLEKRLLLLPITWAAFGLGEVFGLRFLLGPILNIVPTIANDKPIGGSIFPVLFFNVAAVLVVLGVSLYSLGIWKVDLSGRKERADLGALAVLFVGGGLLWYVPVAIFFVVAAIIYLLATNIE
jgi:GT2 family glycosyltransferase